MGSTAALMEVFREVAVGDIQQKPREVVSVTTATPLVEAFQKLLDNGIQSAPVWSEEKNTWIGFLDLRDLVSFCVAEASEPKASGESASLHAWLLKGLRLFQGADVKAVSEDQEPPVHTHISYLAARHPFKPIHPRSSLTDAVQMLAKRGCHRLPILRESHPSEDPQQICNIFSQTSVIEFLHQHIGELGDTAYKTVQELNLGTRPCISVKDTDTACEALKILDQRNLAGMAIVDSEDGKLVGNTSGSDLGNFLSGKVSLELPIFDFLAQARQSRPEKSDKTPTITCLETDQLQKVVAKLAKTKVHHIFIVDSVQYEKKPLGVISVSDICRLLAKGCTHVGITPAPDTVHK